MALLVILIATFIGRIIVKGLLGVKFVATLVVYFHHSFNIFTLDDKIKGKKRHFVVQSPLIDIPHTKGAKQNRVFQRQNDLSSYVEFANLLHTVFVLRYT